jgi:membrane associated rhomboid family serine protease
MLGLPALDPHGHDPTAPRRDAHAFRRALLIAFAFTLLLWWIKGLELLFAESLAALGIRPGSGAGLIGVLAAPLLHGSIEHLLSNSLPLIVLGTLALYAYPRATRWALPLIWLGSGLGTWLIGRPSLHFGASGLTHGLMFYLFVLGVVRWEPRSIAVAMITFFLYGGMLITVLPREPGVSWEAHLTGALAGLVAALLWRRRDPLPPRRKYSWDLEAEAEAAAAPGAQRERDEFELPRPAHVPVLWQRGERDDERGRVIAFPGTPRGDTLDDEPPTPTRH